MASSSSSSSSSQRRRAPAADVNALRRIGEALLLAQNRARVSTERANQCERLLRSVLSQINLQSGALLHELETIPRSMSLDALSDWELLHSLAHGESSSPSAQFQFPVLDSDPHPPPPPPRRQSLSTSESQTFALTMTPHALVHAASSDSAADVRAVAFDVVMNLHIAARNAERRILKMQQPRADVVMVRRRSSWFVLDGWLYRWVSDSVRPWHFVAGIVVGFVLGVSAARQTMQRPSSQHSKPRPLAIAHCRAEMSTDPRMKKLRLAASRLPVAFAVDDMSHLLYPTVETA
ncbi:hypothetical protein Poli38472_011887 [Pythium oligandrum]|uniref:Uncharacterized protein n=1 Tax=Pythium oligandrum TaxID=41045 RepID=A0A8K1C7W6_PYTOL|nr:hypothetical protein Poli38472_011887 [Pythium oligandrum]|eukprot:TMW58299.1 hypothetical protein Poli38472_011887 [Pythium oligandrum]